MSYISIGPSFSRNIGIEGALWFQMLIWFTFSLPIKKKKKI